MKGIKKLFVPIIMTLILSSCDVIPSITSTSNPFHLISTSSNVNPTNIISGPNSPALTVTGTVYIGLSTRIYENYDYSTSSFKDEIKLENGEYNLSIRKSYYVVFNYIYNSIGEGTGALMLTGDNANITSIYTTRYFTNENNFCAYTFSVNSREESELQVKVGSYENKVKLDSTDEIVELKTIFPFISSLTKEGLNSIGYVSNLGSVAPTFLQFNSHYYSTNKEDLEKAYTSLVEAKVYVMEKESYGETPGEGTNTYTYNYNSGITSNSINVTDNIITGIYFASNSYELVDSLYTIDNFYGYSFLSQSLLDVKFYFNKDVTNTNFDLSKLIFIENSDVSINQNNLYSGFEFIGECGTITITDENSFTIKTTDSTKNYTLVEGSFLSLQQYKVSDDD